MALGRTLARGAGRADGARGRGRGAPGPLGAGVHARRAAGHLAGRVPRPGAGRGRVVRARVAATRGSRSTCRRRRCPRQGRAFDLAIAVAMLAGADGPTRPRRAAGAPRASWGSTAGCARCAACCLPSRPRSRPGGRRVVVPGPTRPRRGSCRAPRSSAATQPGRGRARATGPTSTVPDGGAGGRRSPSRGAPGRRRRSTSPTCVGQDEARAALEVAAAGGHHLLMVGPPGTGKTMLAARLPGLLPDLSEAEAVEVTAVHSVAGTFDPGGGLLRRPPFEDPHHTATPARVVGGGSGLPRPGAASRAHRGVLFLDEAPEFSPRCCRRCGSRSSTASSCSTGPRAPPATRRGSSWCSPPTRARAGRRSARVSTAPAARARRRYFGRLSGPLLDRVDLQVEVQPVPARVSADRGGVDGGGRGARGTRAGRAARAARRRRRGAPTARSPGAGCGTRLGRTGARRGPGPRAGPRHAEPARRRPRAAGRVDAGRPGRAGRARTAPTSGTPCCCAPRGNGA